MGRTISGMCWSVLTVALWLVLGQLIFVVDVGARPSFGWGEAGTCALLILAPAVTFVPIARWSRIPLYDGEAIAGWATFGFIVTFLRPSDPPTLGQFLVFLIPLTVALATVGTLVSYAAGFRVYRSDPRRFDVVRSRRQGYVGAFFVVALILLHSIGTLTLTSGTFLLVIVALAEMFWLARGSARAKSTRAAASPR